MMKGFRETYKFTSKHLIIIVMKYLFGKPKTGLIFDGKADSIIILGQERFGDLIVLTPLIKKLRQSFPESKITLLGVTRMVSFLSGDPNLTNVVNIKHASAQVRKKIFRDHYDLLFNTKDHPSFTFLFLTARIHARYKIGIDHRIHLGYFNYMHRFADAAPTVEKNMGILSFLGITYEKKDLIPYLPLKPPSEKIGKFVNDLSPGRPIGINLSASNPGKEWPLEHWETLISEIKQSVVILAMPDDVLKKERLERTHKNVIPSPSTPSLLDAGYLILNLKLLITTDTALVHVAGCYNVPVVVLYRLERDMRKFPPLSEKSKVHISLTTNLADISPEEVIDSTRYLLDVV